MTLLAIPPTSGKKHVPTEEGKGFGAWEKKTCHQFKDKVVQRNKLNKS